MLPDRLIMEITRVCVEQHLSRIPIVEAINDLVRNDVPLDFWVRGGPCSVGIDRFSDIDIWVVGKAILYNYAQRKDWIAIACSQLSSIVRLDLISWPQENYEVIWLHGDAEAAQGWIYSSEVDSKPFRKFMRNLVNACTSARSACQGEA